MRVEIARSFEQIQLNAQQWEDLLSRSQTHTVFQTREWLQSWWSVFGHGCEMLFLQAIEGERVLAFAPLMVSEPHRGGRQVRFIGDPHADYCDFVISERPREIVPLFFEELLKLPLRWEGLALRNIPEGSATPQVLQYTSECLDHPVLIERRSRCLSLGMKEDAQAARKLSKKYSLRRPGNYLQRQGELVVRDFDSLAEAEAHLERFFCQHVDRWHGTRSPSLFRHQANRDLYTEVLRRLFDSGRVLFSVVEFNGHPVSYHYGYDYNGSVLWYKPSFDMGFHKRSPGLILVKHLIDYGLAAGRHELDFTIGDEDFKHRFANVERHNVSLKIFRQHRSYFLESSYRAARRLARSALNETRKASLKLASLQR